MRSLIAVSLLICAWVSTAWAADQPLAEREWTVDGVARKALVYSPPTATKEPTPVVFAFHGHGGTMAHAARKTLVSVETIVDPGWVEAMAFAWLAMVQ